MRTMKLKVSELAILNVTPSGRIGGSERAIVRRGRIRRDELPQECGGKYGCYKGDYGSIDFPPNHCCALQMYDSEARQWRATESMTYRRLGGGLGVIKYGRYRLVEGVLKY